VTPDIDGNYQLLVELKITRSKAVQGFVVLTAITNCMFAFSVVCQSPLIEFIGLTATAFLTQQAGVLYLSRKIAENDIHFSPCLCLLFSVVKQEVFLRIIRCKNIDFTPPNIDQNSLAQMNCFFLVQIGLSWEKNNTICHSISSTFYTWKRPTLSRGKSRHFSPDKILTLSAHFPPFKTHQPWRLQHEVGLLINDQQSARTLKS
jgi:hypothetical protein